jgi:radical SAM modification target selenobiotic family peptide
MTLFSFNASKKRRRGAPHLSFFFMKLCRTAGPTRRSMRCHQRWSWALIFSFVVERVQEVQLRYLRYSQAQVDEVFKAAAIRNDSVLTTVKGWYSSHLLIRRFSLVTSINLFIRKADRKEGGMKAKELKKFLAGLGVAGLLSMGGITPPGAHAGSG